MKPISRALLKFASVCAGGIVVTLLAWAAAAYFAGSMTLEGAFLVSPFVGVLFVPMLLICIFQGVKQGYLAYRSEC